MAVKNTNKKTYFANTYVKVIISMVWVLGFRYFLMVIGLVEIFVSSNI